MQDMQTVIVLLSIIVTILSIMVVVLLALAIVLLVKIRKIASTVDTVTTNIARATEWLSPAKVFKEISQLFGKRN